MPAFDEDIVLSPDMTMFVTYKRSEVYPTIVTKAIKIADNPVTITSAFNPSVLQRAEGFNFSDSLNVDGMGVIMPVFSPEDKFSCTIFQIGTSRSRLQYLHFNQNVCEADEDYLRSPVVYSALDVAQSYASDLIIQDVSLF